MSDQPERTEFFEFVTAVDRAGFAKEILHGSASGIQQDTRRSTKHHACPVSKPHRASPENRRCADCSRYTAAVFETLRERLGQNKAEEKKWRQTTRERHASRGSESCRVPLRRTDIACRCLVAG
eukprot:3934094-Rhodomonas_salina.6